MSRQFLDFCTPCVYDPVAVLASESFASTAAMDDVTGTEESAAVVKQDRKALQDYTTLYSWVTADLWVLLASSAGMSAKAEKLFCHACALGLRNPSESTYGLLTALLLLAETAVTSFQAHSALQTTKTLWRSHCKRFKNALVGLCFDS